MKTMDEADSWWVSDSPALFPVSGPVLCNRCQEMIMPVYPAVTYQEGKGRTGIWYLCEACRDVVKMEMLL